MQPWRPIAGGIELRVRLTPKSSRDAIEAVEDTPDGATLKARVTAVPEDGKANAALVATLAKWLGVSKSSVTVTSGPRSRLKTLTVSGEPALLARKLDDLIANANNKPDRT